MASNRSNQNNTQVNYRVNNKNNTYFYNDKTKPYNSGIDNKLKLNSNEIGIKRDINNINLNINQMNQNSEYEKKYSKKINEQIKRNPYSNSTINCGFKDSNKNIFNNQNMEKSKQIFTSNFFNKEKFLNRNSNNNNNINNHSCRDIVKVIDSNKNSSIENTNSYLNLNKKESKKKIKDLQLNKNLSEVKLPLIK